MIKRAPSRNQRSKGIKVKSVLQICLLLGVCFWLIYQVKHSHDKKKEFDHKDLKVSVKAHRDDEILKLGRKDLPRTQEAGKNKGHEDEEEDAVEEEENKPKEEEEEKKVTEHGKDANKLDEEDHEDDEHEEEKELEADSQHEEEEQEEETENEEIQDERRGAGDDELDEQDLERTEGEVDLEDGLKDDEKEGEGKGDDREGEGNESEVKKGRVENEISLDDHDHDGVEMDTHVTREEHYKADDASSAVSHDNQIAISETEKSTSGNSNENSERNVLEEENKSNTTDEIGGNQKIIEMKSGQGELAESGSTLNGTTAEEKVHGPGSYNSQDHSSSTANNTSAKGGTGVSNNSTGYSSETTASFVQNGMETRLDANPTPDQNVTLNGATNVEATNLQTTGLENANNSDPASNGNQFDSNTVSTNTNTGTRYPFNNSVPALSETVTRFNATADGDINSGSSTKDETVVATQNGTSNSDSGTNKSLDSSTTEGTVDANNDSKSGETNKISGTSNNEIVEAAKRDSIDSSDSSIVQDEKQSQKDLSTLPDIRAEVDNSKAAAAE